MKVEKETIVKKNYILSEDELYTIIGNCVSGLEGEYCDVKNCPLYKYCQRFLNDDFEEDGEWTKLEDAVNNHIGKSYIDRDFYE